MGKCIRFGWSMCMKIATMCTTIHLIICMKKTTRLGWNMFTKIPGAYIQKTRSTRFGWSRYKVTRSMHTNISGKSYYFWMEYVYKKIENGLSMWYILWLWPSKTQTWLLLIWNLMMQMRRLLTGYEWMLCSRRLKTQLD